MVSVGAGAHPGIDPSPPSACAGHGAGCRGRSRGLRCWLASARLPGAPESTRYLITWSRPLARRRSYPNTRWLPPRWEMPGSCSIPAGAPKRSYWLGPALSPYRTRRTARCSARSHRVLRGGGLVWAAALAALPRCSIPYLTHSSIDPEFSSILDRDLAEGQHRNPTGNPNYFTDAFFSPSRRMAWRSYRSGL